jgi:hypothetical protein
LNSKKIKLSYKFGEKKGIIQKEIGRKSFNFECF